MRYECLPRISKSFRSLDEYTSTAPIGVPARLVSAIPLSESVKPSEPELAYKSPNLGPRVKWLQEHNESIRSLSPDAHAPGVKSIECLLRVIHHLVTGRQSHIGFLVEHRVDGFVDGVKFTDFEIKSRRDYMVVLKVQITRVAA